MFSSVYKSRAEELAEAIELGNRRFRTMTDFSSVEQETQNLSSERLLSQSSEHSSDSGIVRKPALTPKTILKANLLKLYHDYTVKIGNKTEGALFKEREDLKKILDVLNNIHAKLEGTQLEALFHKNPAIRRTLMLFKDACPVQLRQMIQNYELNRCEKNAGCSKKELIQKLKEYLNQTDKTQTWENFGTEEELELLKQGRTGRFLAHFCEKDANLYPPSATDSTERNVDESTGHVSNRIEDKITELFNSINARLGTEIHNKQLPMQEFLKGRDRNWFSRLFNFPIDLLCNDLSLLLSDPEVNFFVENNLDDLSAFKEKLSETRARFPIKIDYDRMAGLAALAYYEHPAKIFSTRACLFSIKEKTLPEAKIDAVALLKNYFKTGTCQMKKTDTKIMHALHCGKLGEFVRSFGGIDKMKATSSSFAQCFIQYESDQRNHMTRMSVNHRGTI